MAWWVPSGPGCPVEIADANAAIFGAARGFAGCLPGIDEVLRRQDLPEGTCRLDPRVTLSPGQDGEIDRGDRASPHLRDNAFAPENLNDRLRSDHVGLRQVGTAHHPRSKAVGGAHP